MDKINNSPFESRESSLQHAPVQLDTHSYYCVKSPFSDVGGADGGLSVAWCSEETVEEVFQQNLDDLFHKGRSHSLAAGLRGATSVNFLTSCPPFECLGRAGVRCFRS
jgi:hypothetical protein